MEVSLFDLNEIFQYSHRSLRSFSRFASSFLHSIAVVSLSDIVSFFENEVGQSDVVSQSMSETSYYFSILLRILAPLADVDFLYIIHTISSNSLSLPPSSLSSSPPPPSSSSPASPLLLLSLLSSFLSSVRTKPFLILDLHSSLSSPRGVSELSLALSRSLSSSRLLVSQSGDRWLSEHVTTESTGKSPLFLEMKMFSKLCVANAKVNVTCWIADDRTVYQNVKFAMSPNDSVESLRVTALNVAKKAISNQEYSEFEAIEDFSRLLANSPEEFIVTLKLPDGSQETPLSLDCHSSIGYYNFVFDSLPMSCSIDVLLKKADSTQTPHPSIPHV